MKKLISIVIPCFNEEENIEIIYSRLSDEMSKLNAYDFEVIFIDNSSTDSTVEILKKIALSDLRIKIIVNIRNFGYLRSPYWAMMQTSGSAVIGMACDLQDPPELICEFINHWEKGWKLVLATKPVSYTNPIVNFFRKTYYRFLNKISRVEIIKDTTGFGLYDKVVIDEIRKVDDPYPYIRGLISEFGYPVKTIPFDQPRRKKGISKNNFFTLFDLAMLGIVSHSKLPIRLATFLGIILSVSSFCVSIYYLIMKLLDWNAFPIGIAPLGIGIFFTMGLLFIFIGLLGEYIGSIHTYLQKRPVVIEKERINF